MVGDTTGTSLARDGDSERSPHERQAHGMQDSSHGGGPSVSSAVADRQHPIRARAGQGHRCAIRIRERGPTVIIHTVDFRGESVEQDDLIITVGEEEIRVHIVDGDATVGAEPSAGQERSTRGCVGRTSRLWLLHAARP